MAKVVTIPEKVSEYIDGNNPAITTEKTDNTRANPIFSLNSMRIISSCLSYNLRSFWPYRSMWDRFRYIPFYAVSA